MITFLVSGNRFLGAAGIIIKHSVQYILKLTTSSCVSVRSSMYEAPGISGYETRFSRSQSCSRLHLQILLRNFRAPNRLSFSIFTCTSHFEFLKVYINSDSTEKLIKGDFHQSASQAKWFNCIRIQITVEQCFFIRRSRMSVHRLRTR